MVYVAIFYSKTIRKLRCYSGVEEKSRFREI